MNILSYSPGSRFTGAELNRWCEEQIQNHFSHEKEAHRLYNHYIFKDQVVYELKRGPFGPGQDPCRDLYSNQIIFEKVN